MVEQHCVVTVFVVFKHVLESSQLGGPGCRTLG